MEIVGAFAVVAAWGAVAFSYIVLFLNVANIEANVRAIMKKLDIPHE
jgi:hypothetical protein